MDICSQALLTGSDIKLGGYGHIVQIDESVFTQQDKVIDPGTDPGFLRGGGQPGRND